MHSTGYHAREAAYGLVSSAPDKPAIAIWSPPGPAPITLSAREARALFLRAQGFGGRRSTSRPADLLDHLAAIQLDSVNVLARNHELVPFARLGPFDLARLTRALYHEGRGFEYWAHEASWLPLREYRYLLPRMEHRRAVPRGWWKRVREEHAALYEPVLERIRAEGPLTAADFDDPRANRGTWWDWKPAKLVLEDLFDQGLLMVRDRVRGFTRLYDLPERVLPASLDTSHPGDADATRHLLLRGFRAMAFATGAEAADYFRLKPDRWRPALRTLLESGAIVPVSVEGARLSAPVYAVPEALASIPARFPRHRPTFLAPFDNLIWERGRVERLFGFRYRVEIYVPEPKRQYGYYVLPLLVRGSLRGRADARLDRKASAGRVLRVRTLWLEGAEPAEAEAALVDLAAHLGAADVQVERTVSLPSSTPV